MTKDEFLSNTRFSKLFEDSDNIDEWDLEVPGQLKLFKEFVKIGGFAIVFGCKAYVPLANFNADKLISGMQRG